MMVTLVLTQNQRIENPKSIKNIQEHEERHFLIIKLTFIYVTELKLQHMIYQIDQEKLIYNMESSKQSHKIIYKNS